MEGTFNLCEKRSRACYIILNIEIVHNDDWLSVYQKSVHTDLQFHPTHSPQMGGGLQPSGIYLTVWYKRSYTLGYPLIPQCLPTESDSQVDY